MLTSNILHVGQNKRLRARALGILPEKVRAASYIAFHDSNLLNFWIKFSSDLGYVLCFGVSLHMQVLTIAHSIT